MAYEIPQQLEHKEKIVFGLTFSQLGWALLFLGIILIIFKQDIPLNLKFIISIIPGTLGILFVYFNFSKFILNLYDYFKRRNVDLDSREIEDLIKVKEIKENKVISKDDIAILEVSPINFTIKTETEKEAIIIAFQKFLNSIDFPVQFLITTNNLNVDSYLDELKSKTKNKTLVNDFLIFIKELIENNKMRNRNFYFILTKKSSLDIQCDVCIERFKRIGLKSRRLNNKEILDTYYNFFNDINDMRKEIKNDLNPLHYLTAPNSINIHPDHFKVNDKFCRVIHSSGYPRSVEKGFLDKIISSNDDFDISIHIEPYPIDSIMLMLNRELQKQRADLYSEELKNSINPSLEIKYKDTLNVLENLQKGNEKLFNVSLYIICKAQTKEELDYLTKKVEAELNSIMIVPKIPLFKQIQGYQSTMPLALDILKEKRNITTKALSAFFPFTSPFLTLEKDGIMLGLNKNKVPFIRDIYKLSNANGVVLATSGSGKSYFTKLLILRQLLSGVKIMIIDPQNEYVNLTNHCKGELITISKTSETIINPLDLMGHDFVEKRLTLIDLFKIMFGEITEIQRAILDKAITETYAKKGITSKSYKDKKMPILSDLYDELNRMNKKANQVEKLTYQALLNRLYMYTEGVFSFMNRQTNIHFKNDFVCFNIGDMPKQVKPVVMFLILDYVYSRMKDSHERKLLVVDEAWSLLGKTEEASYIFEIVKTCRKFNLGLLLITQDVEDLISSKAGNAVLSNSSYSLLLRQKPSVINNIVKLFQLSGLEKEYLLTATQGNGILIMDNDHQEIKVVASKKEHKIITTNADEILSKGRKKLEVKDTTINLDVSRGLFYGKELNIDEKNYLANHGYEIGYFMPIGKKGAVECWIKRSKVESLSHAFLIYNIRDHLEKIGKVELFSVQKPDIEFTNKRGEKIAIEVETGSNFRKSKQKLYSKYVRLREEYGEKIIFVLTNSKYKDRYNNLFEGNVELYNRKAFQDLLEYNLETN